MDRKARHEQFVTGLSGGSIWEVYGASLTSLLGIVTHHYVAKRVAPGFPEFLADFVLNWAIVLASVTIYSGKLWLLASFLLVSALISLYTSQNTSKTSETKSGKQKRVSSKKPQEQNLSPVSYRPFVTIYRSALMVTTVTAILAVDFPLFPRRFAKTETWGTSLMDLGVGSFVFSLGVISVRKRFKQPNIGFSAELRDSILQTSKILALGFIRLASVKLIGYQEHVSEYGVHWNFFFTLGLLPFAFVIVNRTPFVGGALGKAVAIALGYEIMLKNSGLQEWALAAPRVSLITANKEGLTSFIGYLAIFFFGYSLGLSILSPKTSQRAIITQTAKWAIIAQISYTILTVATQPSRRIANLPYVVWVVAFNAGTLSLLACAETYLGVQPPHSYNSVNTYGESVFIMANLATGLVNTMFDTLSMGRFGSLLVLLSYQMFILQAANYLYTRTRRQFLHECRPI